MIVHQAAYAFLLLSFQRSHQIRGEFSIPTIVNDSQSVASNAKSRKIHSKAGNKPSGDSVVGANEYDQDQPTEKLEVASADAIWPTYSPTIFTMDSPNSIITTPPIVTHEFLNCDPIGSRPGARPRRNNPVITRFPSASPIEIDFPVDTGSPSESPDKDANAPPVTFRRGDLNKDISRFGIKVSSGMMVRKLATADYKIGFANGEKSKLRFHSSPDGAAIIPLDSGYVYVSNSEVNGGGGGVYGIYFNHDGGVVDYKRLLDGTTRNCSGGTTPWGTFVSCEEYGKGQCWQVDPDPASEHHNTPMKTKLGGQGGNYESVACDDRNPSHPIFFVTEDDQTGVLRRYTPPPPMEPGAAADWDALHADGGNTEFLVFLDDTRFTWSCDETLGRFSQEKYYPNLEGIDYEEGMLYFVSKRFLKLYVLDLDNGTYETSATNEHSLYRGEFKHQPDQLVRNREDNDLLYFTEDGGQTPGVYAIDAKGQSYAIFEAYDEKYFNDETTGLEFSPDGTKMYACFQDCGCEVSGEIDCGCLFAFWRDDGRSFDGATMHLKYHSSQ